MRSLGQRGRTHRGEDLRMVTSGARAFITIPSSDEGFREHVARIHRHHAHDSADQLQSRLRLLFPRVLVRERQLSGESPSWYIYRDGAWAPPASEDWWLPAGVPRVSLSPEGWITHANPSALGLLAIESVSGPSWHYTDFVAPGTLADAMQLFDVLSGGHEVTATILLRPRTGDLIADDIRASRDDGFLRVAMRLAEDVPVPGSGVVVQRPAIQCEPTSDPAFRRYAEDALARMPEPTVEGLELRLHRLYPHAHVSAGPGPWIVHRDRQAAEQAQPHWWMAPDLPTVRYDMEALIFEANEPAKAMLGSEIIGRHWQDLVIAGSADEVAAMLAILAEVGAAESRFRMPGADGRLVEFDSYTTLDGATSTTVMRPRLTE
jgi:hypothetical protein